MIDAPTRFVLRNWDFHMKSAVRVLSMSAALYCASNVFAGASAAEAQVVEWAATTSGRMIDIYDVDLSDENLIAAGYVMFHLADAAYWDIDVIRQLAIREARFEEHTFIRHSATSTEVSISRDNRVAVVAVRGSDNAQNWMADLTAFSLPSDAGFVDYPDVHIGFMSSAMAVDDDIMDVLDDLRDDGVEEIWLTGHSLGGALAQLLASKLERNGYPIGGVVTFASPAPGRAGWSNRYASLDARTNRFENEGDIVPCLPADQGVWRQNGTLHVLRDGSISFRTGARCMDAVVIPSETLVCSAPRGVRIFLSIFAPHTLVNCSFPDVLQAIVDLVANAAGGEGFDAHYSDVYGARLQSVLPEWLTTTLLTE